MGGFYMPGTRTRRRTSTDDIAAAVTFAASSTALPIYKSKNVSGVTRLGTGTYRITFERPLDTASYGVVGSARYDDFTNGDMPFVLPSANTTLGVRYDERGVDIQCPRSDGSFFDPGVATALISILITRGALRKTAGVLASATWDVDGSGVITIRDSHNVRDITRPGAGAYLITYEQPFADNDYAVWASGRRASPGAGVVGTYLCPRRFGGSNQYDKYQLQLASQSLTTGTLTDISAGFFAAYDPSLM